MIKNIIFDIGKVLVEFFPLEVLNTKYDKETANKLYNAIFKSKYWDMLDNGDISYKEVVELMAKESPKLKELIYITFNEWTNMLKPKYDNIKLLEILRNKGYKIYLLSNFHNEAYKVICSLYPEITKVDGQVISCYEHTMKPDNLIFEILLNRYSLNNEECLFIDDTKVNIDTAISINISCIHYLDNTNLTLELNRIGVL